MVVGGLMLYVGGCAAVEPPVVALEPHAVTAISAAAASVPSRTHTAGPSVDLILPTSPWCSLPPRVSHRARKYAPAPRPRGCAGRRIAAPRRRHPYSGARPRAARPRPSGRCTGLPGPHRRPAPRPQARRSCPVPGMTVEPGVVEQVVYVGQATRYNVRLDGGEQLVAVRQNTDAAGEGLRYDGRRIRVAWAPEHTFVLDEKPAGVENTKER